MSLPTDNYPTVKEYNKMSKCKDRGSHRLVGAKMLDYDIIVRWNPVHAMMFTFDLILLGKI